MPSARAAAVFIVVAAILAVSGPAGAQRAASTPTIPLSDVRRGMRGYGLTVFQGTEPERFDVEVIGVMHNFLPRQDIILIRCSHPTLEHSGIVGGPEAGAQVHGLGATPG